MKISAFVQRSNEIGQDRCFMTVNRKKMEETEAGPAEVLARRLGGQPTDWVPAFLALSSSRVSLHNSSSCSGD